MIFTKKYIYGHKESGLYYEAAWQKLGITSHLLVKVSHIEFTKKSIQLFGHTDVISS
jgi:hypothetical protein